MANEERAQGRPLGLRTVRLEAFSDGVFAIAITLLAFDIAVPAGSEDDLLRAVADEWPSYLAYVISFSTIGVVWLGHTVITEYLERANAMVMRLNLLLLLVVAFIPFPTRLVAEFSDDRPPARVAVTIYGITLLVVSALVSLLWRYALRERLVRPDAADEEVQALTSRLTPSLAGYVVMIVCGLFLPVVAVVGYLAIAIYRIVPLGLARRRS